MALESATSRTPRSGTAASTGDPPDDRSAPTFRGRLLQCVEAGAQEREHRVEFRRDVLGLRQFRPGSVVSFEQQVEGRRERRGNDLRAEIAVGSTEVLRDRGRDQFLELSDAGSEMTP